ncbi:restriction endonuclease subunit S [Aliarcobacter butzleri]|uniref:restriction endonuclease subunit S n=1 Tax=Aliarcobacter butzleri TaxID=28197 RepID=UPI00125F6F37|nr:restriction endonuclease subunit S [Aliarcobacter butzleri]MDN5095739.1 restriction endonuclease subunit S [Aliarcobacter butzleri]
MSIKSGYKQTKIGIVPEDWNIYFFEELGSTYNGLSGKTKEDFGEGLPYITYMNIFSNSKIDINNYELVKIENNESQNVVKYGDIFFTVSSETLEEVGLSSVLLDNVEQNMYLNSFCFGFRLNNFKTLLPEYARFLFREFNTRKRIKFFANGTTRINISKVKLMKLKLAIPPIEEQKKISDILSTVDKKIAFVEENINATEELKKGLMQKLLTEGIGHAEFKDSELGRIPESWGISNIGNIFNIFVGRDLKEDRFSKEKTDTHIFPVFSNTVDNNGFYGYYDYEEFNGSSLTVVGRGIGVGTAFTKNGSYGAIGRLLVLFPQKGIEPHFYTEYINFKIKIFSESSGIPQLTGTQIKNYKCPIPPLEEQKQIAEILSTVDNKLENLKEKKQSFEELKKGLMQKLLTGEVRV